MGKKNGPTQSDPRDNFKSFEISEARQYPRIVTTEDLRKVAGLLESQEYEVDYSAENGPIKLLCARGKGSFSVIPIVLFKSEEFTGSSLITLATWGKIRSRAAVAGPLTLGTSVLGAVPHHLKQKSNAKSFLQSYWSYLDTVLGNGHTVAAPLSPNEAIDPIWANPACADPSLAELHYVQPVISADKNPPKGKFEKFDKWRKGTRAAEITAQTGHVVMETGAAGMDLAGGVLPIVGIGFGYAQYKHAQNYTQKGSAMGRMIGSSTMIPLAGLVGSRIGKSIGKKSDGKPTCFEETERTLWQKKKVALIEIGIFPEPGAPTEGVPLPQFDTIGAEDRRGQNNQNQQVNQNWGGQTQIRNGPNQQGLTPLELWNQQHQNLNQQWNPQQSGPNNQDSPYDPTGPNQDQNGPNQNWNTPDAARGPQGGWNNQQCAQQQGGWVPQGGPQQGWNQPVPQQGGWNGPQLGGWNNQQGDPQQGWNQQGPPNGWSNSRQNNAQWNNNQYQQQWNNQQSDTLWNNQQNQWNNQQFQRGPNQQWS